jgi:hypothetical protein
MAKKNETKFSEKVKADVEKIPATWTIKTQEKSRKGVPDRFVCLVGLFVAIEEKDEGEEPTPLQAIVLADIQRAKGIAFSTTPSAWPAHYEMLKDLAAKRLAAIGGAGV